MTAEEASSKRELVKKLVVSILCSAKEGLTEQELRYEYRSLTNEPIPYTQLGFKSVYELVKNLNVAHISRLVTGQYVFHAVFDELTQDLGQLVANQIDREKTSRDVRRVREGSRVRAATHNRFGLSNMFFSAGANHHHNHLSLASTKTSNLNANILKPFVPSNIQRNIQAVLEAQETHTIPLNEFQIGNYFTF